MNFGEVRFWEILLGGLALIAVARLACAAAWKRVPETFDRSALTALGLVMLLAVSWTTFVIYITVVLTTYFGLKWILRHGGLHPYAYLAILIPLQLAPLFYYKYADFACNQVLGLGYDSLRDMVLPVGISFYIFQKVAFVVDTLGFKQPLPGFLDYLTFAGFFPQIVAGPIERRHDLLPQMESFRFRWSAADIDAGATWIVTGLFFKCCLADNLANYVDRGSADNAFLVWATNVLFGLRIYYDFAGYSLVAVGLARCLGVKLTLNFLSPYCSTSITEFWRRWHITLSQWFRDYLYIPLGGGRTRWWVFTVLLVFIVSGVWHGAGWNFILWGALHGIYLVVHRLGKNLPVPRVAAWGLTMLASLGAWLAFYETDTAVLMAKVRTLLTPGGYSLAHLKATLHHWAPADLYVMACVLALATVTLFLEWQSVARHNEPYHYLRRPWISAVLVILAILLAPGESNAFIYFAF